MDKNSKITLNNWDKDIYIYIYRKIKEEKKEQVKKEKT